MHALENTKNTIHGVLPYIAPEILRGKIYTKAADIYSLGIIIYEVISGLPPYHDVSHDENLAIKICQGLRPRFNIEVPHAFVHLIKSCLDANPLNRPTAKQIRDKLLPWHSEIEELNNLQSNYSISSTSLSYETHSEAIYTSRLLKFNNLPKPKNSDDYYEQ
ncbi:kinase-like domain-containing protein [Glomus cerebriforme]|uniref:Kinase-like domain-containing protein n=1 Tax=Glomus cerebriforme TaxID=658196 RepID=A0A397SQ83_9GLOM|nr:kinase-like domain-containing protein [Glomus cerebriforme]